MNVIWNIASTTVGEAIRRRVLLVILLIGVLLVSIVPALSILSARSETSITIGTMFAVLRGTSALIAIILTIYMIPNEIERRTIYTILSKPVQRWQFLLGKYFGAVIALLLMIALMTVMMLIMFAAFQHPPISKIIEVSQQPFLYWIEMSLLSAVGIFFSTFLPALVNFFVTIGMWLVGTVLNPLYDTVSKNSQTPQLAKMGAKFITNLLPNFANYDVKNPIINPGQAIQNQQQYYISVIGYGLLYIGILLAAGIIIFDRREV
jgi:ABC-type transport system involved in multi-copper enzyme maturation permease subunit